MDTFKFTIIVVALLVIIFMISKSEAFTSFYSEYGPTPYVIFVEYEANNLKYPELDPTTKTLRVLEIFKDLSFKLYSDDGYVRAGMVPEYLWTGVRELNDIAYFFNGKRLCGAGNLQPGKKEYYIWVNGYTIYLGEFRPKCMPTELFVIGKLMDLFVFSDLYRSNQKYIPETGPGQFVIRIPDFKPGDFAWSTSGNL